MTDDQADLLGRLDTLADRVDRLRVAVDEERDVRRNEIDATVQKVETARRARHRSNWALAAAAAAALAGAVVSLVLAVQIRRETDTRETERVHAAVVACENGNVTRAAIVDYIEAYTTVLGGLNPPATVEETARRAVLIDKLRSDLAARRPAALNARDCSPAAAAKPTTIAPNR